MLKLRVTTVGGSVGFIFSKKAKARLNVQKCDTLYLAEAPDGALRISPYDPDFKRQMEQAKQLMHDDREILRALAK